MTLVTDTSRRALASGLAMTFLGEGTTNWGYMMAASIVAAIPVTIVFAFLQRYFFQGLTAAARQIKSCVALAAARNPCFSSRRSAAGCGKIKTIKLRDYALGAAPSRVLEVIA